MLLQDANGFFNLINTLHEKTSIIITTNKAPTEWAQTLDDEVLATALLDRLLYRCEVIKLTGASYRMENRKLVASLYSNADKLSEGQPPSVNDANLLSEAHEPIMNGKNFFPRLRNLS